MVSDFNKKGNSEFSNKQLMFRIGGVFLLLFFIFMIVEDIKIYQKKQDLLTQINFYQKQVKEIKNNNQKLQDEIVNSSNADYLEKIGYEQFGQTKPGETEYMFVKTPKKVGTNATNNSSNNNAWFGWFTAALSWIKTKF